MMTPQQRLTLLADRLEANANNPKGMKFDLNTWLCSQEGNQIEQNCGTTGCAIGLALLQPEFNAEGFKPSNISGLAKPELEAEKEFYDGWSAVRKYFDLSDKAAQHLFHYLNYEEVGLPSIGAKAELAVAQRIRAHVATLPPY